MSKFHSTVSRRTFMKGLGFGAAGLGAAAVAAPVFHDVDELASSSSGVTKRPWWVKEIDKPKNYEFDSSYKRYDKRTGGVMGLTGEQFGASSQTGKTNTINWVQQGKSGYTRRDLALKFGARTASTVAGGLLLNPDGVEGNKYNMVFIPGDELGVAKWSGTPEENTHTVKNAARLYGVDLVTISEVDERLFYAHDGSKIIEFQDVDKYQETDNAKIIPRKYRYVITLAVRWSIPITKTRLSPLGDVSGRDSIEILNVEVKPRLAEFIRYLGYNALPSVPAPEVPFSITGGMGEMSRTNRMLSPEIGQALYSTIMLTDLPMAPDKPIDFGLGEFCVTCKKCAEYCPVDVVGFEDEPHYVIKGIWNNPGHLGYFEQSDKCSIWWLETNTLCAICVRACTFTKYPEANIHQIVQSTIANTTIFNGFLKTMDDVFGYGEPLDAEEVWQKNWSPHGWYLE